ncbi:ABC transporter ATP-binding protein [Desulfosediminicola flagellatus]|uniref:ABC transporter ATP-binding protein n=1 Tax=Desulfosediminicola flagellatus TaxID=2569541 RepID=UPI0010AD84EC|nr:ABC transporter ATP-binding protein [Desulfosediminicola flagellatus]
MIQLTNVTKSYPTKLGRQYVIRNVTCTLPSARNIAILGRNGAGKSTLLKLLGGIDFPDRGEITTNKRISWPLGLSSGFQGSMTGRENCRFVCRIHGQRNFKEMESFVQDFSDLGVKFDLPIKTLSSGQKARIAFGMSMAFDFDIYLLDEITSVGDPTFRKKARALLEYKRKNANIIMVSHAAKQLRQFDCNLGIVVNEGKMVVYDDLEEAISIYQKL